MSNFFLWKNHKIFSFAQESAISMFHSKDNKLVKWQGSKYHKLTYAESCSIFWENRKKLKSVNITATESNSKFASSYTIYTRATAKIWTTCTVQSKIAIKVSQLVELNADFVQLFLCNQLKYMRKNYRGYL